MDTAPTDFWRRCSNCKKPIALGARYFVCSVSTCQRARAPIQFCKEECWEVHNEIENHRDGWCEERRAPMTPDETTTTPPAAAKPSAPATREPSRESPREAPRHVVRDVPRSAPSSSAGGTSSGLAPADKEQLEEILVVVSRLKGYIRTRSSGMNTSDDVLPLLSDHLRKMADEAIVRAREAGRKTVMARDFPRP